MKEQELNKLLDKAIGTKGNLKVPSFWMRKIFKELIEWCKSQNNSQNSSQDYVTKEELNNKQDWIPDLNTIRNNANNALKSIPPEYITEAELEQKKCRIDWYIIVNPRTRYLTFEALEDGTFSFIKRGTGDDIQYSKDNGSTWTPLASGETVSVVSGDKVMWKSTIIPVSSSGIGYFSSSNKFNVSGNIMSLLYGDDFNGQTNLEGKDNAFRNLFTRCSYLIDASNLILPATTLADYCYDGMFADCTSLTTAPELTATTMAYRCYQYMFSNCTSLTTAPSILPATTLANECYSYMFQKCISLTTAPELPTTTLADYCYSYMFKGCTSLSNITMLATDISAFNCLYYWVQDVSSTGTFVKHPNMTSLPSGISGIPESWEVKDMIVTPTECTSLTITADDVIGNATTTTIHYTAIYNGIDKYGNDVIGVVEEGTTVSAQFPQNVSETETVERIITFEFMGVTASTVITQGVFSHEKQYLTFEAIEDSTFTFSISEAGIVEYSLDGGQTWVSLSSGTNTPTVPAGSKIMFKSPRISIDDGIGRFNSTGKFNVSGNIMSMLYGDDFEGRVNLAGNTNAFAYLFNNCAIVNASNLILPATTLADWCYSYMFKGCTSLVAAPALPATTLANSCYNSMFKGCTSLTTAPELPATTLANGCYLSMFNGCTSLVAAPELPATNLADMCYYYMFEGCESLTTAPALPATTLTKHCYSDMFSGCTSLTTAPVLPATTLANYCYYNMFNGCSSLTQITMLATDISAEGCLSGWASGVASTGTFTKAASMTSLSTVYIPSGWTVVDYVES